MYIYIDENISFIKAVGACYVLPAIHQIMLG
jgi:hypothetical protein